MADTLNELGFAEGADLAVGLATVGIVSGIIIGTALCDWSRRKGYVDVVSRRVLEPEEIPDLNVVSETPEIRQQRARLLRNLLIDPLSINFAIVGMLIALRASLNSIRQSRRWLPFKIGRDSCYFKATESSCRGIPS